MSASTVFNGREVETTEEELATTAVNANVKQDMDGDEQLPLVESDIPRLGIDMNPGNPLARKPKRGRPNDTKSLNQAEKKLKRVNKSPAPMLPGTSTHHVTQPFETQSSSQYETLTSTSPDPRNPEDTVNSARAPAAPAQLAAPATVMEQAAPLYSDSGSDTEANENGASPNPQEQEDEEDKEESAEPVEARKKRGRPRKNQTSSLSSQIANGKSKGETNRNGKSAMTEESESEEDKEEPAERIEGPKKRGRPRKNPTCETGQVANGKSKKTIRVSARLSILGANRRRAIDRSTSISVKKPAAAFKKNPTTHGRGVARVKKTSSKGKAHPRKYSQEEYKVEQILDSLVDDTTKEHMYMVKWDGYSHKHNTWEPKSNLGKCTSLIKAFNSKKGKASKK